MKKIENNEELKSRREFFKKAAKGVLPVLGTLVLAGTPYVVNAVTKEPMGCRYGCNGTCQGCRGGCTNACRGCGSLCRQSCSSGCARSAY